jgi:Wadjet protein JetD, C-terminal
MRLARPARVSHPSGRLASLRSGHSRRLLLVGIPSPRQPPPHDGRTRGKSAGGIKELDARTQARLPHLTDRWLCVWGKGSVADGIVAFLKSMSDLPIAAWCDLDAYGIRIVSDLGRRLERDITPIAMSVDLYVNGTKYSPDDLPESQRSEADALLRDWARRLVWAHLKTREDQDFALSQKSMIGQTMREYGGRFLFELIQNGYDAEPFPRGRRAGHTAVSARG